MSHRFSRFKKKRKSKNFNYDDDDVVELKEVQPIAQNNIFNDDDDDVVELKQSQPISQSKNYDDDDDVVELKQDQPITQNKNFNYDDDDDDVVELKQDKPISQSKILNYDDDDDDDIVELEQVHDQQNVGREHGRGMPNEGCGPNFENNQGGSRPDVTEIQYAVPANKCGLVIGKGGKTIKNINQVSGAYVTLSALPTSNAQEKIFVIRGEPPQIEHAKDLINKRIGGVGTVQIQMTKEEEEYEKQFKDWEKKFETWKQENQNHPDKETFAQYEKQWQEWHEQLLQMKEQMHRSKAQLATSAQATTSIQTSMVTSIQASAAPIMYPLLSSKNIPGVMSTSTNGSSYMDITVATATTPGMYYQHPQYMYMQPYMYPDATPMPPGADVVSPAVLPPAIVPLSVVPPVGVPPVSMPATSVPPQNPYNAPPPQDSYNQQPCQGMPGPDPEPVPRPADTMGQHSKDYNCGDDLLVLKKAQPISQSKDYNCGDDLVLKKAQAISQSKDYNCGDDLLALKKAQPISQSKNYNCGDDLLALKKAQPISQSKDYNCGDDLLALKKAQPISQSKNYNCGDDLLALKKAQPISQSKNYNCGDDLLALKKAQPISQDNIGYQLHQKQGCSIGKDFGRIELGCHDPISCFVKDDMNFGRVEMETKSAKECTKKRRLLEAEEQDSCNLQQEYEKQKELEEKNYWINVVSKWRKVDCDKEEKAEPLRKLDVRPNWIDVISTCRKVDCEKGEKAESLKQLDVRSAPIVKKRDPVEMGTGEKFIRGGGFRAVTDMTLESGNQEENTNDCEETSPINSYDSAFFEDTSNQSNGNESDFYEDLESEISNQFLKDAEALCDELESEISYEINLKEAEALCNELESKEICYNDPVVKGSPNSNSIFQNIPLTNDLDILLPEDDVESSKQKKYCLKCTVESAARQKYALDDLRYLYMNTIFFTSDDVDLPPLPDDCANLSTINFTPRDADLPLPDDFGNALHRLDCRT